MPFYPHLYPPLPHPYPGFFLPPPPHPHPFYPYHTFAPPALPVGSPLLPPHTCHLQLVPLTPFPRTGSPYTPPLCTVWFPTTPARFGSHLCLYTHTPFTPTPFPLHTGWVLLRASPAGSSPFRFFCRTFSRGLCRCITLPCGSTAPLPPPALVLYLPFTFYTYYLLPAAVPRHRRALPIAPPPQHALRVGFSAYTARARANTSLPALPPLYLRHSFRRY